VVLFRSLRRLVGVCTIPLVLLFSVTGGWYFMEWTNITVPSASTWPDHRSTLWPAALKLITPATNTPPCPTIAFLDEETCLYGSKHVVNGPTIDLGEVSFICNMDMVGRLDEEKSLVIRGGGTSPTWYAAFTKITTPKMKVTTTDSGIGLSDHTFFYLVDIPAPHFFTRNHQNYANI
jgi:hypothetical protein